MNLKLGSVMESLSEAMLEGAQMAGIVVLGPLWLLETIVEGARVVITTPALVEVIVWTVSVNGWSTAREISYTASSCGNDCCSRGCRAGLDRKTRTDLGDLGGGEFRQYCRCRQTSFSHRCYHRGVVAVDGTGLCINDRSDGSCVGRSSHNVSNSQTRFVLCIVRRHTRSTSKALE